MEKTGQCLYEGSCPAVKELDSGDFIVVGKVTTATQWAREVAEELGLGIAPGEDAVIVPRAVMLEGLAPAPSGSLGGYGVGPSDDEG